MEELRKVLKGLTPSLANLIHGHVGDIAIKHAIDRRTAASYLKGDFGEHKPSQERALRVVNEAVKILKENGKTAEKLERMMPVSQEC